MTLGEFPRIPSILVSFEGHQTSNLKMPPKRKPKAPVDPSQPKRGRGRPKVNPNPLPVQQAPTPVNTSSNIGLPPLAGSFSSFQVTSQPFFERAESAQNINSTNVHNQPPFQTTPFPNSLSFHPFIPSHSNIVNNPQPPTPNAFQSFDYYQHAGGFVQAGIFPPQPIQFPPTSTTLNATQPQRLEGAATDTETTNTAGLSNEQQNGIRTIASNPIDPLFSDLDNTGSFEEYQSFQRTVEEHRQHMAKEPATLPQIDIRNTQEPSTKGPQGDRLAPTEKPARKQKFVNPTQVPGKAPFNSQLIVILCFI